MRAKIPVKSNPAAALAAARWAFDPVRGRLRRCARNAEPDHDDRRANIEFHGRLPSPRCVITIVGKSAQPRDVRQVGPASDGGQVGQIRPLISIGERRGQRDRISADPISLPVRGSSSAVPFSKFAIAARRGGPLRTGRCRGVAAKGFSEVTGRRGGSGIACRGMNGGSKRLARQRYANFRQRRFERLAHRRDPRSDRRHGQPIASPLPETAPAADLPARVRRRRAAHSHSRCALFPELMGPAFPELTRSTFPETTGSALLETGGPHPWG